jgi:hypothetical protein
MTAFGRSFCFIKLAIMKNHKLATVAAPALGVLVVAAPAKATTYLDGQEVATSARLGEASRARSGEAGS